jgi:LysM repeat protein
VTVIDPVPPAADQEDPFDDTPRSRASRQVALAVQSMCPYLETEDGWRSLSASRDHRCQAVPPGLRIPLDEQRRLCLKTTHVDCPRFLAARAARPAELLVGDEPRSPSIDPERDLWQFAKAIPATVDDGRIGLPIPIAGRERTIPQAGLGVVMVAVIAILVATRFAGGQGPTAPAAAASRSPTPIVAVGQSPTPEPSISAAPPSPAATAAPDPTSTPRPSPTGEVAGATATAPARTYRVRSGDTLYGIALRFGTTVKAIQELNGIDDPSRLRVGQVLQIP